MAECGFSRQRIEFQTVTSGHRPSVSIGRRFSVATTVQKGSDPRPTATPPHVVGRVPVVRADRRKQRAGSAPRFGIVARLTNAVPRVGGFGFGFE